MVPFAVWPCWPLVTWLPADSILRLPNGDLVVAGSFSMVGQDSASNIAIWNGSLWSTLGSGIGKVVSSILLAQNGDIIVGGAFRTIGSLAVNGIARWNGNGWAAFGSGITPVSLAFSPVRALVELPNGDIVVGGFFPTVGGQVAHI